MFFEQAKPTERCPSGNFKAVPVALPLIELAFLEELVACAQQPDIIVEATEASPGIIRGRLRPRGRPLR
jgi:hypothetical protein